VQICPNCGEENPDRFRICGICGTKLAVEEVAPEVRKTVTIVFSDLKGSTALGEALDTESVREVLNVYFNAMKAVLERHGGTVEKFIGDAIMAVFGLPTLHEDDALRAVRAALEMKATLKVVNDRLEKGWGVRLENRTGVNTGDVVAGDVASGQRLVTGDAVNTAARLEQAAPALEILIGEPTYRLVRDSVEVEPVEPLELKGKAEPVPAYQLRSVRAVQDAISRRMHAPMIGRLEELESLTGALDDVEEHGRPRLVTVVGPAGVGKSRLLREFLAREADRISAVRGRCLSYGDGITFWPLGEVIRQAADISDDDPLETARAKLMTLAGEEGRDAAERVAAAIGLSDATFPVRETFWGARRLLEVVARERPAVMLIDDVHWAEPTFLELLSYLLDSVEAPVLIVCSSRPDLLHDQIEWVDDKEHATWITLSPLSEEESARVVENVLGAALEERLRARIIEAAEGNPLFVEHMVSMLIDEGVLRRDETGAWVIIGDQRSITIPPSILALLTARLDRLSTAERAVIGRGAVIGQVFFRGGVEYLVGEPTRPLVEASLGGLKRKELIHPDESMFAGQEAYRFAHILIRDAAYLGLLKRTRAELHERFVDWLEEVASDRIKEYEEIRGYHLEQAYTVLMQLAPVDDHARQLGLRAAGYLASAGHRALARADLHAASNLLQRAATLLPPEDERRSRHLLDAGEALMELGEFRSAEMFLEAGIDSAARRGDSGLEATGRMMMLSLRYETAPEESGADVVAEVERTMPLLEELRQNEGLARAWRMLTLVHWEACRWGSSEIAARRMVEYARRAGNTQLEDRVLPALATCALYGPTPVPDAIERCTEILGRTGSDRKAAAVTKRALAHLEAMRGQFDRARELCRESRSSLEELGWKVQAAVTSQSSGPIELLAGDPVAAEVELLLDFAALDAMGEKYYLSTTAAFLAEALYQQDRLEDAAGYCAICRELASPDDISSQFLWRSIQGKILARTGDLENALSLGKEAVALIDPLEDPDAAASTLLDLAEIYELGGRLDDARDAARRAEALLDAKQDIVSRDRARKRLADLGSVHEPSGG
jgi:class 3 adenylate cyclase/tetratricopeptide (TPR) repeat protein